MHTELMTAASETGLNRALFGYFPYIALAVMVVGSILRFDREQYTWRSGSSQLLRKRQMALGSNLFHLGILFLLVGHAVGLLTPHAVYSHVISAEYKQLLAIIAGSIAGAACFVGLTILMHRRFFDARIRRTSSFGDNAILLILWVQLCLGLLTVPYSLRHEDASIMLRLSAWAQGILTFQPDASAYVQGLAWPYQAHLVVGLTIFLIVPFTRLVHIFSAPVWYLGRRGWQVVRTKRPDLGKRRPASIAAAPAIPHGAPAPVHGRAKQQPAE